MTNQSSKNAMRQRMRQTQPLTGPQRSYLGRFAESTRRMLIERGAIEAHEETAKEWRHREAREATKDLDPQGIGWTISEAPKQAFDALKARFEMLSGQAGKALETLSGPSNDMRTLAHEIDKAAKTCGVGSGYIAGICKRQSGGTRTTWTTPAEGKAVLVALTKHAASLAKKAQAEALASAGCC